MSNNDVDLHGNIMVREEEINLIYDGPSFKGKMEISHLASQLKSTEFVIKEIISELYKQKKFKKKADVKIFLTLKNGSFEQIIFILFNNPLISNTIAGSIIALFTYFLTKENNSNIINIENLINNHYLAKNLYQIIVPLEHENDILKLISSDRNINLLISSKDKLLFKDALEDLKKNVTIEIYDESFFGYLSIVDIDKNKFGFTLEGTRQHIPITFEIEPSLDEIRNILGYRLKIDARAIYEEKILKELEIHHHELKTRTNLKDFEE